MPVASCPNCGESARLPLDLLPEGSSAECPWCGDLIQSEQWQRAMPPMVRVFDADGNALSTEQLQGSVRQGAAPPVTSAPQEAEEQEPEEQEPVADDPQPERTEDIAAVATPASTETAVSPETLATAETPASPDTIDELGSFGETEAPASVVLSEALPVSDSPKPEESSEWDLQRPDPIDEFESEAEPPLGEPELAYADAQQLVSEESVEDHAPSHDEAFESESDFAPDDNFDDETFRDEATAENETTVAQEVSNTQKKVPLASDQRSYYERHEWGRDHRRSIDRARAFRLAIPTLIVLPLVVGAVAFSGVNLGFYPFDGSLKLASSSGETGSQMEDDDSDDASGEDSNTSDSPAALTDVGDLTSIATPSASGVPTTAPRNSVDSSDPDSSDPDSSEPVNNDPDKTGANDPESEEFNRDVETVEPVPTPESASVAKTSRQPTESSTDPPLTDDSNDPNSQDEESKRDPDVPEMDWLDALVAGDADDPVTNEQAGSATDSIDIAAPPDLELPSAAEENAAEENAAEENARENARENEENEENARENTANESEEASTDVVASTNARNFKPAVPAEAPEEATRREQEDLKNSLLVFPHEPPEPKRPRDEDVAAAETAETPDAEPSPEETPPTIDTDSEELKVACDEAVEQLAALTLDSSGRDQALTYRGLARLGAMTFEPTSKAIADFLNEASASRSIQLFKGLESTWAKSSRRDTEGIFLVGRLRSNGEEELWYETSGGEYIEVTAARDVPRDVRSIAIGRIVEVEPKIRVELVGGAALQ